MSSDRVIQKNVPGRGTCQCKGTEAEKMEKDSTGGSEEDGTGGLPQVAGTTSRPWTKGRVWISLRTGAGAGLGHFRQGTDMI